MRERPNSRPRGRRAFARVGSEAWIRALDPPSAPVQISRHPIRRCWRLSAPPVSKRLEGGEK